MAEMADEMATLESNTTDDGAKKTGFLDLSPELRNKIYELALDEIDPKIIIRVSATPLPHPTIAQTCRVVRQKFLSMLYGHIIIHFNDQVQAQKYLKLLGDKRLQLLKDVRVDEHALCYDLNSARKVLEWIKSYGGKGLLDDSVVKIACLSNFSQRDGILSVFWLSLLDLEEYEVVWPGMFKKKE